MASPEEVTTLLPETLPEDFSDWDGEESRVPLPGNSSEPKASEEAHSETPILLGQSADYNAILESLLGRPRASVSASPAPVFVKQQRNFIDRDSQESPTRTPVSRSEWEAWEAGRSFSRSPKPLGQPADRGAILESRVDRPRVSDSASPAPVSLKQQKSPSELVNAPPSRASHAPDAGRTDGDPAVPSLPNSASADGTSNSPELTATLGREANEALFEMFRLKNPEVKGKPKTASKKWMTVPVISGCSILLLLVLMIPLFHHGTRSAVKQSVQPASGASDPRLKSNTLKPSASGPFTQEKPLTTAEKQQTTDHQPTDDEEGAKPAQVQAEMMNDQLTAPTQIPQGIKKPVADNGPPPASFGAAGADGLGGNGAIDFNGHAQRVTKVAPLKPLVVSSGVAAGMLIQKMAPYYPPIAKSAHVSGTVELHATISKDGTIKDLHVVSGPAMLRQAAADAVRNWRYKPYRLNNEPTEIETTISVIFSLDR